MKIFKHQHWHLISLIALLIGLRYLVISDLAYCKGSLFGLSTKAWLIIAVLSPILHQIYVFVFWRLELYYKSLSKTFGARGFVLFKIFFTILIISRPISIILLAISNAYTIQINNILSYSIAAILFIPAVYLAYSIKNYFGTDRAFGIDHFQTDIFRDKPFVKRGIFKYSSNAMYVFGFLALYIPGFLFFSKAALIVALFSHIYIWVHYYFTELPDMRVIYSNK